jgi:hypothetical protein
MFLDNDETLAEGSSQSPNSTGPNRAQSPNLSSTGDSDLDDLVVVDTEDKESLDDDFQNM